MSNFKAVKLLNENSEYEEFDNEEFVGIRDAESEEEEELQEEQEKKILLESEDDDNLFS